MKKAMRWTLRFLLITIALITGFLGYLTLTDYRPMSIENVGVQAGTMDEKTLPDSLSMLIWNIGYGGLSQAEDFFFDGGNGVRAHTDTVQRNMEAVADFLAHCSDDFIFLQEVDVASKRSYYLDETAPLAEVLAAYSHSFAMNYNSKFVPQPITNPMGKVQSGLMSFGKIQPQSARRFALAPDAGWPVGLFMLDRCFMEWRFPVDSLRDLILINIHLSAYDDGMVKQQQLDSLQRYLLEENARGHWVVAGGDWNMHPPDYHPTLPETKHLSPRPAPAQYPEAGWRWVHPNRSSNRWLDMPYIAGKTTENLLDYFLVSPGLEVYSVECLAQGFRYSDHEPVRLRFGIISE